MATDQTKPDAIAQALTHAALGSRYDQTFPVLTAAEIDRMRRFGTLHNYADGEKLFETGQPAPGMFVVLAGNVAIMQHDGMGHITPVVEQGAGQFLAEVGQLSNRATLVDGIAQGAVETLLIPPHGVRSLLVAEADLGERIMRALILRRVNLIQSGVGGPALVGRFEYGRYRPAAGLSQPQWLAASSPGPGDRS